jgi:hypothetical protein
LAVPLKRPVRQRAGLLRPGRMEDKLGIPGA